jgi:HlyD family secretion protein
MALWLVGCGADRPDLPTAVATRAPFEVRLSVQGEMEAKTSSVVVCPDFDVSTKIGWLVEEGTRVKKGDKLVEFDTAEMEDNLESARSALEVARTKIEQNAAQLRLRLADAEAAIRGVELDLRMAKMRVTESETVPLVDREEAKANAVRAEMAIEAAKSALETTRLQARAELQLLELEVEENERNVAKLERQLAQAVLVAPTDGLTILAERWDGKIKVGTQPWSGSPLVTLPDLGAMQAVAWVHEVDSPRVALGQTALVVMDAHPASPVEGTVAKVADLAVARGEDQIKHLKVTLELSETNEKMKPGMTVRANLLVEARPDALSVPIEAVHEADGERYVHLAGLAGWSRQEVVLGPRNDTHVVVEQGLEDGAVVALVDPEAWASGEVDAATTKPAAEPAPPSPAP